MGEMGDDHNVRRRVGARRRNRYEEAESPRGGSIGGIMRNHCEEDESL